jgi:hypothetical protein
MICLFVLCILESSLDISVGKCHLCCICLVVDVVLLFCIVFLVFNANLICMSLTSFVIFIVSFPLYEKVTHFVSRCCGSMSVLCLYEALQQSTSFHLQFYTKGADKCSAL